MAMIAVRKKFETLCGKATKQWRALGAVMFISGVGLLRDPPHTQTPARQGTSRKLNPVTALKIVSGC